MRDPDKVREIIPSSTQKFFDDIRFSRVLGATRHVQMIGEMLIDIIEHEDDQLKSQLKIVIEYFKTTRGNESRAVYNAINIMTKGYESLDYEKDLINTKEVLKSRINSYDKNSQKDIEKIINFTNNLLVDAESILLFDYSSTLNNLLINSGKKLKVYIAESRALAGGKPFIDAAVENGHETYFFPDTTMYEVMKKCDVAFIGAESFYADGTVFNTIGSEILALVCKDLKKPLYVLTPLVKLDERNIFGENRLSPMPYDYSNVLAKDWEDVIKSNVDFHGIKLARVNPELYEGLVTESGIIPPAAVYGESVKYLKAVTEDNYEN